ncbi:uncharacterized protein LOC108683165 [Hyalella azteca]|uniref:Uncharacterized protein LOC108683165 n=1 Tax=Hyalella azteca TaxID=294128 RepID=A0A8B7PP15_HYAAZ|nr:uncharacterized protein LOC108683165 [Hyalella azteca]
MSASTAGPLQEISVNTIKTQKKNQSKRLKSSVQISLSESSNHVYCINRPSSEPKIFHEAHVGKENQAINKVPLLNEHEKPIFIEKILVKAAADKFKRSDIPQVSIHREPKIMNETKAESILKESNETKITVICAPHKTPTLFEEDKENRKALKNQTTATVPHQGSQETTVIKTIANSTLKLNCEDNKVVARNLKEVRISNEVAAVPGHSSPSLRGIKEPGTPIKKASIQEIQVPATAVSASLPVSDSSTSGGDVQTPHSLDNSTILLASVQQDSNLTDCNLDPSIGLASDLNGGSANSLTLIPSISLNSEALCHSCNIISPNKPFDPQNTAEDSLPDTKPLSIGIAVKSPLLQSASSQVNDCKSSQKLPLSRRNARERNRVRLVSQGFAILRQHVPQAARRKKLSKVETLRCAVDYIKALSRMIEEYNANNNLPSALVPQTCSFEPRTTASNGSFEQDASQVKHERDEHRHPLHEVLQRQHLQTMLPIDSTRLLNASMLSKQREQCLHIAPNRHEKDGTQPSSNLDISSGNSMLRQGSFNLPLNEPQTLGYQLIEFPSPSVNQGPVALCAAAPLMSIVSSFNHKSSNIVSIVPSLDPTSPVISSIVPSLNQKSFSVAPIANNSDVISSNVASVSPTTHNASHAFVSTPTCSDSSLPDIAFTSPVTETSLIDEQNELFDGNDTEDSELMDCLSLWQETP